MPTILCIDDDPKILELQRKILETNGYSVLSAPDGPTGIALAAEHPVDLVVLDFKMPGMDGGEVADVLFRKHPNLPVVICTGYFDAMPEWLRWFAVAILQKGDGPGALLAAIQDMIAPDRSARAARVSGHSLGQNPAA